jgi:hypothetical protein
LSGDVGALAGLGGGVTRLGDCAGVVVAIQDGVEQPRQGGFGEHGEPGAFLCLAASGGVAVCKCVPVGVIRRRAGGGGPTVQVGEALVVLEVLGSRVPVAGDLLVQVGKHQVGLAGLGGCVLLG